MVCIYTHFIKPSRASLANNKYTILTIIYILLCILYYI